MARCPTQAVLPLVGLAAENVIRDRYTGWRCSSAARLVLARQQYDRPDRKAIP
ncbi:MAG: hypothetical protein ACQESR_24990 [Planctomycetota bacterium]